MTLCSNHCTAYDIALYPKEWFGREFEFEKQQIGTNKLRILSFRSYKLQLWLLRINQELIRSFCISPRCSWSYSFALEINLARTAGPWASLASSGLIQWPCCFLKHYTFFGFHPITGDLSWFVHLRNHCSFYLFQKGYVVFCSQIMLWKFRRGKRAKSLRRAVWLWLWIKL